MRCLTLANALRASGHQVCFLSRQHQGHLCDLIKTQSFEVVELKPVSITNASSYQDWLGIAQEQDADECLALLNQKRHLTKPFDLCIVDHYGLDEKWQYKFKPAYSKMLVIDDLANRSHKADFLLDQTLGRRHQDYRNLVPEHCQVLTGEKFMLLRDEFLRLRALAEQKRVEAKPLHHVLVSLGGIDVDNITATCIQALAILQKDHAELRATVVMSAVAPHTATIEKAIQQYDWITLAVNTEKMAELLLKADIAIGAAGSSAWERCFMGLPTINLILAENQQKVAAQLAKAGAATNAGIARILSPEQLGQCCAELLNNPIKHQQMAKQSLSICDGKGIERLVNIITNEQTEIAFIPATAADSQRVYQWQCEPGARKYSRNPKPPTLDEHLAWFDKLLLDESRTLYLLKHENQFCGFIRLDLLKEHPKDKNMSIKCFEISILIPLAFQGLGIATKALSSLNLVAKNCDIMAHVHPDNLASVKLFKRAGFKQITDTEYLLSLT